MPDQEGVYLAEPSDPGRGGGVLVVHDWYGLLPHVRTLCDELAAAGWWPVLLHLAERDKFDPPEFYEQFNRRLRPVR
jgi:dienelactone hydrolase